MSWKPIASILILALITGCGGSDEPAAPPTPAAPTPGDVTAVPPPPPPPPAVPADAGSNDQPPPAVGAPTPGAERKEAVVGVGRKGQDYGSGPVSTPIAAYFRTRQRVVFDIQIAQAMNVYYALNEHYPKSHEEFMEEIIKKNAIKLPELRSDERYVYDAEKAATMPSTYDPTDPPIFVERTP
jgi:hypothetical protein